MICLNLHSDRSLSLEENYPEPCPALYQQLLHRAHRDINWPSVYYTMPNRLQFLLWCHLLLIAHYRYEMMFCFLAFSIY